MLKSFLCPDVVVKERSNTHPILTFLLISMYKFEPFLRDIVEKSALYTYIATRQRGHTVHNVHKDYPTGQPQEVQKCLSSLVTTYSNVGLQVSMQVRQNL